MTSLRCQQKYCEKWSKLLLIISASTFYIREKDVCKIGYKILDEATFIAN
jgi:hypothetical protein